MAELSAVRTESINGSSICAPALASRGSPSDSAPMAAPVAPLRHWRRDSVTRPPRLPLRGLRCPRKGPELVWGGPARRSCGQFAEDESGDFGRRHLAGRAVAAV